MGRFNLKPQDLNTGLRERQVCWTCGYCVFEPVTGPLRYTCELTDEPVSNPQIETCNEWEDSDG